MRMSPDGFADKLLVMLQLSETISAKASPAVGLRRVVCGSDGTSEAREAVRQAAELAAPGGALEIVVVTPAFRGFAFRDRAATTLRDAVRTADALGGSIAGHVSPAATAAAGLIRAAAGADLLVIGCDALGPTPKATLRRAPCSVLLARRAPDRPLLGTVLIAADGPPAVQAWAAHLAGERGAEVRTAPTAAIVAAAEAIGCGLIVIGDGALAAHVARAAPCSVLVVRSQG
jgi:nucleotide-binding universal stress UspA family protein